MKKILLLNPPSGKSIHYCRDYFCSKALKTNYVEHPVDLLILSGTLFDLFKVEILDATMLDLDCRQSFNRIKSLSPDVIIFLSGTASWGQDFNFMKQVKEENKDITLIGLGDIFWNKEVFVSNEWLDAVLLDFTSKDILNYLENRYDLVKNMFFRNKKGIFYAENNEYHDKEFEIPLPRHELFFNRRYTFPFSKRSPFTTILTDYGCGFQCPFCFNGLLAFKLRKLENVFEELEYVYHLGIKELFIKDQTFGFNRKRTIQLCSEMIKNRWFFSWTAFSRADILDFELLSVIKKAGCHTLILGVETANEELLKKYKSGLTIEKVKHAFGLCRKLNIRTAGTFCIGFPSENRESVLKTIDFAIKLKCDFASFNVFVPKVETPSEVEFFKNNGSKSNNKGCDQSGIASINGNEIISRDEMSELLVLAIRRFYLRPRYIFNRIIQLVSLNELIILTRSGLGLIGDLIRMSLKRNIL